MPDAYRSTRASELSKYRLLRASLLHEKLLTYAVVTNENNGKRDPARTVLAMLFKSCEDKRQPSALKLRGKIYYCKVCLKMARELVRTNS